MIGGDAELTLQVSRDVRPILHIFVVVVVVVVAGGEVHGGGGGVGERAPNQLLLIYTLS